MLAESATIPSLVLEYNTRLSTKKPSKNVQKVIRTSRILKSIFSCLDVKGKNCCSVFLTEKQVSCWKHRIIRCVETPNLSRFFAVCEMCFLYPIRIRIEMKCPKVLPPGGRSWQINLAVCFNPKKNSSSFRAPLRSQRQVCEERWEGACLTINSVDTTGSAARAVPLHPSRQLRASLVPRACSVVQKLFRTMGQKPPGRFFFKAKLRHSRANITLLWNAQPNRPFVFRSTFFAHCGSARVKEPKQMPLVLQSWLMLATFWC